MIAKHAPRWRIVCACLAGTFRRLTHARIGRAAALRRRALDETRRRNDRLGKPPAVHGYYASDDAKEKR